MTIKCQNYLSFKSKNAILHLTKDDLNIIMQNIDKTEGMYSGQAKALFMLLYYSGARPNEVLRLKRCDIYRDNNDIVVNMPASKRGNPRPLKIPLKKELANAIYNYIQPIKEDSKQLLFYHYLGDSDKVYTNKRQESFIRKETAYKLYYYFKKWVNNISIGPIPPYYLRHERCSILAEKGASLVQIMQWKGCKTEASVSPYLHISTRQLDELKRML